MFSETYDVTKLSLSRLVELHDRQRIARNTLEERIAWRQQLIDVYLKEIEGTRINLDAAAEDVEILATELRNRGVTDEESFKRVQRKLLDEKIKRLEEELE